MSKSYDSLFVCIQSGNHKIYLHLFFMGFFEDRIVYIFNH